MPDPQKPSASDFLSAARKQAAEAHPAQVRASRRDVLEELLSHPVPAPDFRHKDSVTQRVLAQIELQLGDILEPLHALPARAGQKFFVELDVSVDAIMENTPQWWCSTRITVFYGTAAHKKQAKNANPTISSAPSFLLTLDCTDTRITSYALYDDSRKSVKNGYLTQTSFRTQDLVQLRAKIGEVIAAIAPARLDDIGRAIALAPHPLDQPAALDASRQITAPAPFFQRRP